MFDTRLQKLLSTNLFILVKAERDEDENKSEILGDLQVSGAAESDVNGTYHLDGEHLGLSRWKHESKDIWLRIGGEAGQVWRFVDSPDGSLLDGRSTKTYYYYSGDIILDSDVPRNPWEMEWVDVEHSDFPNLKVKMLSQVAYSHLNEE